ncbi:helix-turn-helix transcriptional regulator [Nocardia asteroides]|uniref:helix-turn-helix transcriptional regulator n=1 Tax=Nocardia asteroides TaxID=1824 RepID=UPI001E2EB019|nr:YafY family protein [Nocardia asteroides]UGT56199.1 YafY family transcriptional regulator [Nocardia asteroides]
MTDTAARLLRLLSLLQMPREWPGSELADRLGVTDRTVRRDVDRLRELGYPVVAAMGAAGGYRLTAGSALPPLVLDEDEAVAVAVGLRVAAGQSVAIEDAAVRALTKLEQVLPAKLRRRVRVVGTAVAVRAGSGPTVDPEILTVLAAAVTNRERVRMRYHDAGGAESRRHVEPLGVVAAGRRWYLVAYDLDRDGWRSFRADRITVPQPTGARSTVRELPAADAADYVAGRRTDWATPEYRVDVTIDAPLGRVAGRLGAHPAALVAAGPTTCRLVETRDDDPEWLATQLIALGAPFRLRDSPELDARLREIATRIAQARNA